MINETKKESDDDFNKPLIGIASTGYEGNPCNMHLNNLAKDVKKGVNSVDFVGLIFNTIGVSDGISMGTPGMRYSLPSRELITDSMESVVRGQHYDGLICIPKSGFPHPLSSSQSPTAILLLDLSKYPN